MPLSPVEDARSQLVNAMANWDWSGYFPTDYDTTLVKGVQLLGDWPSDQQKNFEVEANGMLTKPIVSVIALHDLAARAGEGASLGDILGQGITNPSLLQHGQVLILTFQVDCWADLQVGAGEQAERIAGGVRDCLFVNKNSLASFRRIEVEGGRSDFIEANQFWRCPVTVRGRLVQSYDA